MRIKFDTIIETIYWIRIVLSPLLVGVIAGALIYFYKPCKTNLIIGLLVAFAGLLSGIIWATRVHKKGSTSEYISRIHSSDNGKSEQS